MGGYGSPWPGRTNKNTAHMLNVHRRSGSCVLQNAALHALYCSTTSGLNKEQYFYGGFELLWPLDYALCNAAQGWHACTSVHDTGNTMLCMRPAKHAYICCKLFVCAWVNGESVCFIPGTKRPCPLRGLCTGNLLLFNPPA